MMKTRSLVAVAAVGCLAARGILACGDDTAVPVPGDDGGLDGAVDPDAPLPFGDGGADGLSGDGAIVCPPYQAACNGQCIPITIDPNNCGGCGTKCPPNEVCSAGVCSNTCLPGLDKCNGYCVDLLNDNKNCGVCGNTCPPNQGCVNGTCQNSLILGPGPNNCPGGGPPIKLDDGSTTDCSGQVAATTFTWALCSCKDVVLSSAFTTDGFDSSNKSNGKLGASVGLDGKFSASSQFDVGGTLWSSAGGGLTATSQAHVRNELHVGGPLSTAQFQVDNDGYVLGNVSGGPSNFAQTLYVSPSSTVTGATYKTLVKQVFAVPQPCDCSKPLPVTAWVDTRKNSNDNALVKLDPAVLSASNNSQPARIDFPCGSYYLDSISAKGPLVLFAHGHTALYIGGDVSTGSFIGFGLDPTATFDVVIKGNLNTSALFKIGNANFPALSRTYVGTKNQVVITSNGVFATNFYAGQADLLLTSNTDAFGAFFVGDFTTPPTPRSTTTARSSTRATSARRRRPSVARARTATTKRA